MKMFVVITVCLSMRNYQVHIPSSQFMVNQLGEASLPGTYQYSLHSMGFLYTDVYKPLAYMLAD